MTVVRSRRIIKGGYSAGDMALIAGPLTNQVEEAVPIEMGPTPEEIEQEIQARLEVVHKEAFVEGFRKGLAEGRRSIEAESTLLKNYLQELDHETEVIWSKVQDRLVLLSMEIGKKVVGEVVSTHETLAIDLARRGIAMAQEQTRVSLLVNPADAEMLRNASSDLLKTAEGVRHIEIVERGGVSKGGIIVECDVGQFDLRPETQLELIERKLMTVSVDVKDVA